jgi:hypothetical protein
MKIKYFIFIILIMSCFGACTYPYYLPQSETIDVNQYGSYIEINPMQGELSGELLAVDNNAITILTDLNFQKKVEIVPLSKVHTFSIRYAKSKSYGWTIPVFSLATISHGVFAIFTFPLNLISTISITASAINSYKYKNITYDQLKMYARFPQGIPANVDLGTIK